MRPVANSEWQHFLIGGGFSEEANVQSAAIAELAIRSLAVAFNLAKGDGDNSIPALCDRLAAAEALPDDLQLKANWLCSGAERTDTNSAASGSLKDAELLLAHARRRVIKHG